MKDFVIAVILAVLIVITIMHDISIYRLGRKVDILQTFIDTTLRQLEGYVLKKCPTQINASKTLKALNRRKERASDGRV